jgi:hypothetical protein
MRVLPVFLIIGLMSGSAGCAARPTFPVARSASTPAPSASAPSGTTSTAEPQQQRRSRVTTERYSGSGAQLVSITPTRQLGVITADTHGTGHFSVHSANAAGHDVELLAEGEDQHRGTRLFNRQNEEDVTALRVVAQGPWTITLKPLESARTGGLQASGFGDDVLLLDPKAAGSGKITSTFDGDGAFLVEGISAGGSVLLADEAGACEVEEALPDGTALIIVEGDGSWVLKRTVPDPHRTAAGQHTDAGPTASATEETASVQEHPRARMLLS